MPLAYGAINSHCCNEIATQNSRLLLSASINNERGIEMGKQKSVVRGILAGMAGGLAGTSRVMNEFVAGPGQKLQQAVQSDEKEPGAAGPQL